MNFETMNMKLHTVLFRTLVTILFFVFAKAQAQNSITALSGNQSKLWIKTKPASADYYIGIGSASVKTQDYQQIAKKNALQDLIGEIKITVNSTSVLQQIDKDKKFKEQYETNIKTTVADEIQNFELADSHEESGQYYVYYRLSKKAYEQQKQTNLERSEKFALQFFDKAVGVQQSGNYTTAIDFYMRTLLSLKNLWGEPIEVSYQEKTIFLGIESYTRLQQLLDQLSIRTDAPVAKFGNADRSAPPFSFQILDSGKPVAKIPVAITPVQFKANPIIYFSDELGRSAVQLPDGWNNSTLKEIELRLDLKSLAQGIQQDNFYDYLIASLRTPVLKVGVDFQNETSDNIRNDLFPFNENYLRADLSNADRYTLKNLRLIPIRVKSNFKSSVGNFGYFMSLHEGIETRRITINETDLDGVVNELILRNHSKDTLFIMSGEIVEGGKQDRVVKNDMLIPPHSGRVKIPVYCVERGRWNEKNERDEDDGHHDHKGGKFADYYSMANQHLKHAIRKKGQQGVWDEVKKINDKNGVDSDTHAYTGHAHNVEFRGKQEEYANVLKTIFDDEIDVIGMMVVSGKQVIGADMFLSHDLFINAYPKLLYSYSDEAITFGEPVQESTSVITEYAHRMLSPELQSKFIEEKGQVFKKGAQIIHISSL